MLPADIFQRIHHSTIVNIQHITNLIRADGGYLILDNGEKLMVSKAKKDMLLQRLGHPVSIFPGSYSNIKITTLDDLLLAEELLQGYTV